MGHKAPGMPPRRSRLTSLTRLVIGGTLAGYDGLIKRLSAIEADLDNTDTYHNSAIDDTVVGSDGLNKESLSEYQTDSESDIDRLRYAVIGWIFDLQHSFKNGVESFDQISNRTGGIFDRLTRPVYRSRILSPIRSRVDRLAERGQYEVDRWIELGRIEEKRSRELANKALTEQVDNSIQYLTSNPEVQELVQSQSVGLIGEIVEETRERTVSADYFLEAWARTILRRPMRSELPEPPEELKTRAIPYRRIQGKIIKK